MEGTTLPRLRTCDGCRIKAPEENGDALSGHRKAPRSTNGEKMGCESAGWPFERLVASGSIAELRGRQIAGGLAEKVPHRYHTSIARYASKLQ